MSLPPATVRIKRKATDEPVEYLRVHEQIGKRQRRASEFVFSRQPQSTSSTPNNISDPLSPDPTTRTIKPISRSGAHTLSTAHGQKENQPAPSIHHAQDGNVSGKPKGVDGLGPSKNISTSALADSGMSSTQESGNTHIRRFHMSRNPLANPFEQGKSRKRTAKTSLTFKERKTRTESLGKTLKLDEADPSLLEAGKSEPVRPQKKPGLAARSQPAIQNKSPNNTTNAVSKPPPFLASINTPWDVNSAQLAAEMQAFTLQEIGKNIAEANKFQSEMEAPTRLTPRKNTPSKFKPKKPALRYKERHPEVASVPDAMELDYESSAEDTDDESEYIIDTYIRIPAHTLESSDTLKNIGLLVLDSQPDIDEFYLDENDSDEEEDEEEDENAEDHYTADYPEDEVDSDDEFDRNAYYYRTHNASDLEEFDEDDATYSDGENDGKPSWMKA